MTTTVIFPWTITTLFHCLPPRCQLLWVMKMTPLTQCCLWSLLVACSTSCTSGMGSWILDRTPARPTSAVSWKTTQGILGLFSDGPLVQGLLSHDNLRKYHIQDAISPFFQCMLHSDQTMPAALWDIHPQCQEPLERNPHLCVLQQEVNFNKGTKWEHVYFVKPADSSDGLVVMLHDAATVLECYHQFKTLATS
jgi:hypothetical protein